MQMCYGCPCTTSTFRQAASRRAGGSPGDNDGARAQQLEDDAVAEHRHHADLHANAQERRAQDLLLLPRRRVAQQSLRRFRGVLVERALICTCSDVLSLGVSRLEHNAGISVRPVLLGQSCEGRRERERRGAGSLLMTHDAGAEKKRKAEAKAAKAAEKKLVAEMKRKTEEREAEKKREVQALLKRLEEREAKKKRETEWKFGSNTTPMTTPHRYAVSTPRPTQADGARWNPQYLATWTPLSWYTTKSAVFTKTNGAMLPAGMTPSSSAPQRRRSWHWTIVAPWPR